MSTRPPLLHETGILEVFGKLLFLSILLHGGEITTPLLLGEEGAFLDCYTPSFLFYFLGQFLWQTQEENQSTLDVNMSMFF